jgi:SAM-dependent methyltransferase
VKRDHAVDASLFDDDYIRVLEPFHPEGEARREVAAIRELVGLAQSDRVLDLGCGWGRHLVLLRQAGHDVVGVDRSLPLLRRAAGPGLAAGDMQGLPFRGSVFDGVLNLATSLGLFLDDEPAVASLVEARRVLRPGGWLLLEGMHRDDVVAGFAGSDRWTLDDGTVVRARRRFDALEGISHEVLRWRGPDGRERTKRHSLRLRTATEMVGLLEQAGLEVREAWGDWDGRPFRHDAPRLIVRAE